MDEHNDFSGFDFPSPPPDPNSPERQKAAVYGKLAKVIKILSYVFVGLLFVGIVILQDNSSLILMVPIIPAILCMILSGIFKDKELKIRCTKRTTGTCLYTVRRHSGKSTHRHPVVEFEAEGVTYTAELSVTCSRHAEGELYTIYYDPLDPATVRTERNGLFG